MQLADISSEKMRVQFSDMKFEVQCFQKKLSSIVFGMYSALLRSLQYVLSFYAKRRSQVVSDGRLLIVH